MKVFSDEDGWIECEVLWSGSSRKPIPGLGEGWEQKGSYLVDAAPHGCGVRFTKKEHAKLAGKPLNWRTPKPSAPPPTRPTCACGRRLSESRAKKGYVRCVACMEKGRRIHRSRRPEAAA